MKQWTRAFYQPSRPLYGDRPVTASPEHIALSRAAAREGMVLLKNDGHLLPLQPGSRLALFGKGTFDYVKGGGGSGDVTTPYVRNLYDGLREQKVSLFAPLCDFYRDYVAAQYAAGAMPGMMAEPALPDELLRAARREAETAVLSISRFSGEGWDRSDVEYDGEYNPWGNETSLPRIAGQIFPEGDFCLTREERALVEQVTGAFSRVVVVLNTGGVMDTAWFAGNDGISSVLLAWQGGMEGGMAAAQLLCGAESPSGKLPDTFAARLEDYPSTATFHESVDYVPYEEDIYVGYRYFETVPGKRARVVYPFGYGLSYTTFSLTGRRAWAEGEEIHLQVTVTNTGHFPGREVVQVYAEAPQGALRKPARVLTAFRKTGALAPGASEVLSLSFPLYAMASYDDLGKVRRSAWLLERGDYRFHIGTSVRETEQAAFVYTLTEDKVLEQCAPRLVPTSLPRRLLADGSYEALPQRPPHDLNESAIAKMVPGTEEGLAPAVRGRARYLVFDQVRRDAISLSQVAEGRATLDQFLDQLSRAELIHLCGGQPNTGVANTFGFGNLPEYGVPNVQTCDGPAGVRIAPECGVCTTAFPCATLLASTWDPELMERVGAAGGEEVRENNLSIWLTPAVCIHRNPLCGRNFEYYSEDPLLTGKLAAAMVRGIQSQGVAATPKHFAANNKETNRKHSDSRLSERALREIYLKQFEIIVKEADPWCVMSAYNAVNGRRTSESRELLEDILRGEWGYRGVVTSDWWTRGEHYKEIHAGNDVKMACGFPERVEAALALGALSEAEVRRSARRVLELILKLA